MRLVLPLALLLTMLASPVRGQDGCGPQTLPEFDADPAAFAAVWEPHFERLYAGIPALSPKEEQWLEGERQAGLERWVQATQSQEYTIQQAKQNARALFGFSRHLKEEHGEKSDTRAWLWFAHWLLEADSGLYLARLVHEQVISEDAIPGFWKAFRSGGFPLKDSIDSFRAFMVRHILICTLPGVMGIDMYGE